MPPNKILGPAEAEQAEKLGLEIEMIYRYDTPPPPRSTLAHCAVHIMQSPTKCPKLP